jgi:ABC-2 type transport system permease protein
MLPLIKAGLIQKRRAVFAFCFGGLALIVLYVSLYPSLQSQIGSYNKLIGSLPHPFLQACGIDTNLTNFAGLLGSKQYGVTWPLLCTFFTVSFAAASIAGEIEKSTLGLWLAAPLSRLKIYWSKFAAAVIALIVFVLISIVAVTPVAAIFNVSVSSATIYSLAAVGGLFGLCILSMAFLATAVFSEKSKVYSAMGAVLLLMYVLNIISAISSHFVNLKYLSLFYYYDSGELLAGKPIKLLSVLVFCGIALFSISAGAYLFKRRDISI